jgi:hypothetical protein
MIASSMLAASVISLVVLFVLMQTCTFLIPYRDVLLHRYGWTIAGWAAAGFLDLFAVCYAINRTLFLKHTGEKLAHLEKQLRTGDSLSAELAARLKEEQ